MKELVVTEAQFKRGYLAQLGNTVTPCEYKLLRRVPGGVVVQDPEFPTNHAAVLDGEHRQAAR